MINILLSIQSHKRERLELFLYLWPGTITLYCIFRILEV